MRRKDREVVEAREIEAIIRRCDCIHLGLLDGHWPYVVPMNFGMVRENETFVFYMHGAVEGKKLELIRQCEKAAFCLDTGHSILRGAAPCEWTCCYESVMGRGQIALVTEETERRRGLASIIEQYGGKAGNLPEKVLEHTAILRLNVETIDGKRNPAT